jgi:two-component system chemotaxis sensor kinase CheA
MALDMSQFYQVFFEEAAEHLSNMETMLLELDIHNPDPEQLNAIFRAAHSIKGSAGTFGFNDLTEVTHILENLLDRIRKGELAIREDMIDAFLDADDILKTMLGAHRGECAADPQSVAEICARLRNLTSNDSTAPAPAAAQPPAAENTPAAPLPATACGYDLRFILDEPDSSSGQGRQEAIDNVVSAIGVLGVVQIVERPATPEQPWHLSVIESPGKPVDEETLREMLEFVARSDSIRISPLDAAAENSPVGAAETAYGFFDEQSPAPSPQTSADDSFGFFEPLPEPAATPPATEADAPDGAYGFFTTPPSPVAQVQSVVMTPASPKPLAEPAGEAATAVAATGDRRAAAKAGDTSIRVNIEKVDQLINLVGELVITQAMLAQSAINADPVIFERLHAGLDQLERNTRDLQESVMSIRMMPISVVFSRFPRVVRDTSQKLGKQVELKTSGENTELDKGLIERISDPLTHLIRNSLDHGIEMPEQRAASGKQPVGTITLKAFHQSGNIVIEVGDDGAGLNRTRILAKARERGLPVSDSMSDQEVWSLIFEAGFSTAEQVTEVSGRGVGMDVVKRNITAMGGRVEIESMAGVGTRMTVRLPLTLAILDGMSVGVGKETYIIPIGSVIESLQVSRNMVKSVSGVERLIQVRGEYLPVLALHEVFGIANAVQMLDQGIMVVLESAGTKFAMLVDALIGQHQVVIKSLAANYRKVEGISGATIMGDGHVAMILDVTALACMLSSIMPSTE